jgi:hypothetical protein
MEDKRIFEPLITQGSALVMEDNRVALCLELYPPMYEPQIPSHGHDEQWTYEMFEEGNVVTIHDEDVLDELDRGSRVIVIDM